MMVNVKRFVQEKFCSVISYCHVVLKKKDFYDEIQIFGTNMMTILVVPRWCHEKKILKFDMISDVAVRWHQYAVSGIYISL